MIADGYSESKTVTGGHKLTDRIRIPQGNQILKTDVGGNVENPLAASRHYSESLGDVTLPVALTKHFPGAMTTNFTPILGLVIIHTRFANTLSKPRL